MPADAAVATMREFARSMDPVESPVSACDVDGLDAVTGAVLDRIAAGDGPGALDSFATHTAAVAGELVRAGVGALAACRAVTGLNDALTVRLIQLAELELGPPPCPYAWLALGSGGRMEQSLYTDQDTAIVYAERGAAAEVYFSALGARITEALARAGVRRCRGGYMADRWHLPMAEWRALFDRWVDEPEPQALVEAEVFLDFRPISGGLPVDPLAAALRRGAGASRFLVGMARAAVIFAPPLGFAGRIRGDHREVDLKRGGLAAVVLMARLYAMAAGSSARSTPDRLRAAAAAGTLSGDAAAALTDAYGFLVELRLSAQLRQVAAGAEPTNRVRLPDLSADERRRLRRVLHTVRELQRATELRFHTDTVL